MLNGHSVKDEKERKWGRDREVRSVDGRAVKVSPDIRVSKPRYNRGFSTQ